jgi:hypothetical protein
MKFSDFREFSGNLYEGLIMSYPLSFFNKKVGRYLSSCNVKYKIDADKVFNTLALSLSSESVHVIEVINNYANVCGYFLALIECNGKYYKSLKDVDIVKDFTLFYESKFDEIVSNIPTVIYHVTLTKYVEKIKKIGLIPKSKSKQSFHSDRIYCAISLKGAESICQEFKINDLANRKKQNYTILKISTKNLKNKFMKDPNSTLLDGEILGIYTHENILPNNITIL